MGLTKATLLGPVKKPVVYEVRRKGKKVCMIQLVAAIRNELEREWVAAMWGGDELVEPKEEAWKTRKYRRQGSQSTYR